MMRRGWRPTGTRTVVVAKVGQDNRYTLHDEKGWLATARDVEAAVVLATAFEMLDLLRKIASYGAWAYRPEIDALLGRITLKQLAFVGGRPDEPFSDVSEHTG
jgi:hypothetical protein